MYRRVLSLSSRCLRGHKLSTPRYFATQTTPAGENDTLQFLKESTQSSDEIVKMIEEGWSNQKVPVNESVVKAYLKNIAKLEKIDALNVISFARFIHEQTTNTSAQGPTTFWQHGLTASHPIFVSTVNTDQKTGGRVFNVVKSVATLLVVMFVIGFLSADRDGKGGIASPFGVTSNIHRAENSDKTFDDVVGVDEAKADLEEIVMYLKDPESFTRLGGKLPRGVLLTGPPGTGKTLLAKAVAGEANVPFFFTSGSEFEEMYVGVGAKRVRDLFGVAKKNKPCIIFIDEIDAIGGSRHIKDQSSMRMTLNQLLVEMDGFEENDGIIVIAATNFADSLDSALIRPGRFDKHVEVSIPDIGGRKQILELYAKKLPLANDVDLETLARSTPGFSGADLSNLINQAAIKASIQGLSVVTMHALEYAKDKIMMGAERKSAVISPETMKTTAFHEAGHALVALRTPGADPIHKATIMPRGRALGMVMQLPEGDQTSMSKKQMIARLDVCMGGRAAEELVFGAENVTSGASSDIQQATRLAKAMVTKYGLSDKVGMLFVDSNDKVGTESQELMDREVHQLLADSYARTKKLLETNKHQLDRIAGALMEYESLSGSEIVEIMNGKTVNSKLRSQRPSRDQSRIFPAKV